MGEIKNPALVKLFIGMIANNIRLFLNIEKQLEERFEKIDYRSRVLEFTYTDYYTQEMGENLKRKFISFERLINPLDIINIKVFTNKLEKKFASGDGKRNINLDPGYLNEGKVVLASTKDNLQRIYLGKGIYAEVTLYYQNKNFHHFLWTYPDYRTPEYESVFQEIRKIFRKQIGRRYEIA